MDKVQRFVQGYLQQARDHGALEQSVLAEGERRGYSERRLRQAARDIGVSIDPNPRYWHLTVPH